MVSEQAQLQRAVNTLVDQNLNAKQAKEFRDALMRTTEHVQVLIDEAVCLRCI